MDHPEIPIGSYCYRDGIVCPHWHKTAMGARCDLLDREDVAMCWHHLVWDQVKECGINPDPKLSPKHSMPEPEGEVQKEVCPCGKEVEYVIIYPHDRMRTPKAREPQ